MELPGKFLGYISTIRRYSPRTVEAYSDVLGRFVLMTGAVDDETLVSSLTPQMLRTYEVYLLDDHRMSARSVNMHLSVISSFCRYLVREGLLDSNPAAAVRRPKAEKRLPEFYREDAMRRYFEGTEFYGSEDVIDAAQSPGVYDSVLARIIISILYSTGIRRSELISLNVSSIDTLRGMMRVLGKGDKMREIPLVDSLIREIVVYLRVIDKMGLRQSGPSSPLLVTKGGARLYPTFVDRVVKREMSSVSTGRKSPHVLRHTIATQLLDSGSDLNSIKELLGHSSLAATQVYTHNSIERLKNVYKLAHPRAKNNK